MKASVVVPAHNEAAVISRLLSRLEPFSARGDLEVVVACNGCTDGTAEVARAVAPSATVLEIDGASKTAALRAADAVASGFPRFYVDADIGVDGADLLRLARRLDAGSRLLATAPSVRYDTSHSSWVVRRYFEVFTLLRPHGGGIHGTGVMGVSAEGRARFDSWPDTIADDYFLDGLFATDERSRDPDVEVVVVAPRGLRDLVARRVRVLRANEHARRQGFRPAGHSRPSLLALLRDHPARLPDVAVYAAVVLAYRLALTMQRRRELTFVRDRSRESAAAGRAGLGA